MVVSIGEGFKTICVCIEDFLGATSKTVIFIMLD